tara:strand:+ start:41245 stop:41916 length:672 start_codon:yes stop_codon:yes gene_type:complete
MNQFQTISTKFIRPLGTAETIVVTNYIFEINRLSLTKKEVEKINAINTRSKIKDRIKFIIDRGGELKFNGTERQIYSNNLVLIDSLLPEITAWLVFYFFTSNDSKMVDLVSNLEKLNPLNFDITNKYHFYTYKMKRFLTAVALGMMPDKVWNGEYDSMGGYLIEKENDDVLSNHIYNKNEFENYLINNTKLDTASSSRHGFGEVYLEEDQLFIKLNLQIRFIK